MLTREQIRNLVRFELEPEVITDLLIRLGTDNLDVDLIRGFVEEVKDHAGRECQTPLAVLDCSGTGGSNLPHFNTSTTAAFVLASGGVKVAKFGNRAAKSLSGSFDLLDALGIPSQLDESRALEILDKTNLIFLFAPHFYPALAKLAPIRRSLPGPSIFNSIGPLLHPYSPTHRLMGTSNAAAHPHIIEYLSTNPDTRRAVVVRAQNGLDEFDPRGRSDYALIENGEFKRECHNGSTEIGLPSETMTAENNHRVFMELMDGTAQTYYHELVCLNAGAGFYAWGTVDSISAGKELASELLRSGAAKAKFAECRKAYAI